MKIAIPWILLFSRTGSEAAQLLDEVRPDRTSVYTTRRDPSPYFPDPKSRYAPVHLSAEQINGVLENIRKDTLVTLHGYMRILPPEVIRNDCLRIYNTHPGDVLTYPELKGKDPQKKAIELGLEATGVVIHRVTEDLDGGTAVRVARTPIHKTDTEETLSERLRMISVDLWFKLLKEQLHYK